jgi:hypothetical protein
VTILSEVQALDYGLMPSSLSTSNFDAQITDNVFDAGPRCIKRRGSAL